MKPIQEVYPDCLIKCDWNDEGFYFNGPCVYMPLLESFGYEIILKVDDDDYSGDSRLIYKNVDQYGLLIFSWVSCCGCDALQACESYDDIQALRQQLFDKIKWDTKENLYNYIKNKAWELEYCSHEAETKLFIKQALELLV